MKILVMLALLMLSHASMAMDPVEYRSAEEEQRFRALAAELRCVMCQNQSLADSNAMIAKDLRLELLNLIREGNTDDEIKQFMVTRYTDFVLYEPPMRPSTWLLWFGPFLILGIGAAGIVMIIRKRSAAMPSQPASDNDNQEW